MSVVKKSVTIPEDLAREVEAEAARRGRSFSAICTERLRAGRASSWEDLLELGPFPDDVVEPEDLPPEPFEANRLEP